MKQRNSAFTMIELIIVVGLIGLLSTIGLMSYSNYARDTRDVARKADLINIQKTLSLYEIKHTSLPIPDNAALITHSGSTLWYQGVFGDKNLVSVKILSHKPTDPSLGIDYSYSLLENRKQYELSTIFEGQTYAHLPGVAPTYAADTLAYSHGTYNARFLTSKNRDNIEIIALQNITSSKAGNHSLQDIIDENLLVIPGEKNLPATYNEVKYEQSGMVEEGIENPVVFTTNSKDLKSINEKREFIKALQSHYNNLEFIGNDDLAIEKIDSLKRININDNLQVEDFFEKLNNIDI